MWVDGVILAGLLQFVWFAARVANARRTYGIKAPAISGHDIFERHFRVQMNTLELLILFVPALWIAAKYWPAEYMAAIGAIYVLGRQYYGVTYVKDPASRGLGFMLSFVPIVALLIASVAGVLWAAVKNTI